MNPPFFFFFLLQAVYPARLSCYHCISQVPLELVQQDARDAFKSFMFEKFHIPPSHAQCGDSEAFEFSSVKMELCAAADQCVKTHVKEMNFDFVMRGCLSSLYQNGFQISTDVSCTGTPATCLCDTELCNTAVFSNKYPAILLFIFFLFQ